MIYRVGLLCILFCINQIAAKAQSCCSGGVPLSGNIGLPVGDVHTWQFALNYDLNVLNALLSGGEKLDDQSRSRKTHAILFEAGYTFSPRFSIDAFLSYVRQERLIRQFGREDFSYTSGIGDAVFLFKYLATNPTNKTHSLQLGLGPKLPLGSADKTNERGIIESADLQPGSGSWDIVFWGNYNLKAPFRESLKIALTTTYRLTGENDDYLGSITYAFGNEFQAILSFSEQIALKHLLLAPSAALRYRKVASDSNNDILVANTGGEWLFAMPGASLQLNPKLAFNVTVELPVISFVEGTQASPSYRFNTGIFYKIQKNKTPEIKSIKFQ